MTKEGKIILFMGSKGGCGQTFISNCIANYLASHSALNILMIDMNFGSKDSRIIYKISEDDVRTIFDIKDDVKNLDEKILKKIIVNFSNSLNYIFPPLNYDISKKLSFKLLEKILKILKRSFNLIILDCNFYIDFNINSGSLFDLIDEIVLVSLPNIISLGNLNVLLKYFLNFKEYLDIKVMINKFNLRPALPFSSINNVIKYPIDLFLPYDKDIEQLYVMKGPASIFSYNLRIVRDLMEMSKRIEEEVRDLT